MTNNYLNVLSTRIFPKRMGADLCVPSGIAERCDWIIFSDINSPMLSLRKQVQTDTPKTIFLSMRAPFNALRYFANEVLPLLKAPFVLISGSVDVTLPNQMDHRWRKFDAGEERHIQSILDSPYLGHWFVENLDEDNHVRMSPLPLGMVFPEGVPTKGVAIPEVPKLADRPLRALCAHRIREGPQWEIRKDVNLMATKYWSEWCNVVTEEISEGAYFDLIQQHAFVICVNGGGLDPSPKAWHAILNGAIPIVKSSALDRAYKELPVAFVPEWTPQNLTPKILKRWHRKFAPSHDIPENRAAVLDKLGIDYWWRKILNLSEKTI